VHGFIDGDPAGVPGRPCGPLPLRRLGAPAPSLVHGHDRDMTIDRGERHRHTYRGRLERRPVVQQEGFQRLAEVVDEMKAIGDLYRLGCPRRMPSA
jgi:hypothetical protein